MENEYYSIVTNIGIQKIAEAVNSDMKVNIAEFAVGDGGGAYYKPAPTQTGLKKEMWRGLVNACYISKNSGNVLVIESVIPSNVGGYTIREMAVFDDEGNMIAICNTPDTQKVDMSDGVIHELDVSLEITVTNTENIQLMVDPNVINATKKDVEEMKEEVNEHIGNIENPHYVTKEQVGLGSVDNTADLDKPVSVPVQEALDAYYAQLTAYADKAIADLINGAPTTMDTLKELADAIKKNQDIQTALDAAIGTKANKNEFDSHVTTGASKTVLGHVKVDDALNVSSANPVQNKVVKTALDAKLTNASDLKDNTVSFTQAATRANITTKEKLSVIFGKIAKYFSDLKTVAFTGSYTDLTNKPSIPSMPETNIVMIKVKHGVANTSTNGSFTLSRANFGINKTWTPNCIFITSHNTNAVAYYDYDASKQSLAEGYDYLWFRTNVAGMVRYTVLAMIPNDQAYV